MPRFPFWLLPLVLAPPVHAQEWGPWYVIGPFDHPSGAAKIDDKQPVEKGLRRLQADGSGVDLDAGFKGKGGERLRWALLPGESEDVDVGPINFADVLSEPKRVKRKPWSDNAVAYLYRRVVADEPLELSLRCGSDDGLRLWFNGELAVDIAVGRGLNPNAHRLNLQLSKGVNHLLVKVANGVGGWAFQMAARAPGQVDQDSIHDAIDRGVEHLLRTQLVDGSWAEHPEYEAGATAYAGYCLLKCGVLPRHPAVQRARAYVLQHPSDYNYSTACELLFLCESEREEDRPAIEQRLDRMLDWQDSSGLFSYPVHPAGHSHDDLSLTLYSALAMQACDQYGVEVSDRAWSRTLAGALSCFEGISRAKIGKGIGAGFRYRDGRGVTGSMTTAGLSVIDLAREGLGGKVPSNHRRATEVAVEAGLEWLHGRMDWHLNPGAGNGHHYFWLYGVERVGSLLELDELGGVPWYSEGAAFLLDVQQGNGAWGNGVNSILALLFLKRASSRVAVESGRRTGEAQDRWMTVEADAHVSIVASTRPRLSMWVQGIQPEQRERLAWSDGKVHVEKVEYLATPIKGGERVLLGTALADPRLRVSDQRFAVQGELPERGEWEVVACVHSRTEPVDGGSPGSEVLRSPPLRIRIPDVLIADQLGYARQGALNLLLGADFEVQTSSVQGGNKGELAMDGRQGSAWRCAQADAKPSLRFRLRRIVKATRVQLSHAAPSRLNEDQVRSDRVQVLINRKYEFEVQMDPDPLKKTSIELGSGLKVRDVELRILSIHGGQLGQAIVGFAEVELLAE